jgi:hypothetical protein
MTLHFSEDPIVFKRQWAACLDGAKSRTLRQQVEHMQNVLNTLIPSKEMIKELKINCENGPLLSFLHLINVAKIPVDFNNLGCEFARVESDYSSAAQVK